jgi:hypothetical protein
LYESRNWSQVRARLQFIVDHSYDPRSS